jgi:hypothetical protein
LFGRGRRSSDDGPDLVKWHREQVVQNEGEPFGGGQGVEHDEQRDAHRVREQRFTLRVSALLRSQSRLIDLLANRLFAPDLPPAQDVQANARDDGGQPPTKIFDSRGIGVVETQPCFLHRVVGLGQRAEHPIGHSS